MKKEILIKQIASEFNVDEIKVSEYFDSIFETLAAAFIKNKNVNISEFGKFRVKTKKDEDGEKQRTVQFSPVKKFADDVNYNFSELMPVQIRLLDSSAVNAGGDFEDYEAEEILLIDFDDEKPAASHPDVPETTEVLILEEVAPEIPLMEKPKEEILIPEQEKTEIPFVEKPKEEVLIPEQGKTETPMLSEEKEEEVFVAELDAGDVILEKEKSIHDTLYDEQIRILDELDKVIFPDRIFSYKTKDTKPVEILSAAKRVAQDTTLYIKEEKQEEPKPEIPVTEEPKEEKPEAVDEKTAEQISEEIKKEEESIEDEIAKLKSFITGEQGADMTEELPVEEYEEKPQNVFENELENNKQEDVFPVTQEEKPEEVTEEEKKEEKPKTSLELESELLQMLEERKKILDEISKLENIDTDDIVDIAGPKPNGDDEKPNLHGESTLDRPRQNIFVDEEGKVLEDLLNLISGGESKTDFPVEGDKITESEEETGTKNEPPLETKHEEQIPQTPEKTDSGSETGNLDELFGSLYDKTEENITDEPKETYQSLSSSEMKIFDRLVEDSGTKEPDEKKESEEHELTSISDLEKMFRSFKTDITEQEPVQNIKQEEKAPEDTVEKTETIKTYDDISNLIETDKDKKIEEPAAIETPAEIEQLPPKPPKKKKKMSSGVRHLITVGSVVLLIILFIFFYKKLVYQPSEAPRQLPVTAPIDSTKTSGNDSVIYADTNKTAEKEEADIVFEKDDKVIKETPKGFYIEFGEYENQFVLAKEIKVLKDKGITPGYEEVKSEGKTYYKMKLGPYNSLKEAKAILPKL